MESIFIIKACLIFLSSLIFSFLINGLFLRFSKNLGIRNIDDQVIRWNTTSKPAFGGISFFIVLLLLIVQYVLIFEDPYFTFDIQLIGIVLAISIAFLMGLADDAYNTNPTLKFIIQAFCALLLIITGTYIETFSNIYWNYALSFLWIVGLMNSINMLDNMDGASTSASLAALLNMLVVLIYLNNPEPMIFILITGIIAVLCGFLYYNWYPSKMYMGDSGSQFLGISLATFSILILWNFKSVEYSNPIALQLILPALAFIIPLSDTTTVVINRLREGKSPFVGGRDHTTHHLSYLGFSDASVILIIIGLGVSTVIATVIAINIENWKYLYTILFLIFIIGIFLSLFLITVYNKKKDKQNERKENKAIQGN